MAVPGRTGTTTPGIYRYGHHHQQTVQRVGPNVTDDYESEYLLARRLRRFTFTFTFRMVYRGDPQQSDGLVDTLWHTLGGCMGTG